MLAWIVWTIVLLTSIVALGLTAIQFITREKGEDDKAYLRFIAGYGFSSLVFIVLAALDYFSKFHLIWIAFICYKVTFNWSLKVPIYAVSQNSEGEMVVENLNETERNLKNNEAPM